MLKNYFKIAIAVLKRRKFFTFVSLFVISFTLAVLLVLTALIDKVVNDNYPDKKRDQCLYITKLQQKGSVTGYTSTSPLSFSFLTRFAGSIKTPVSMGISSLSSSTNTYVNNKKIVVSYKYTDANYWDVLSYDFLEGRPFTKQEVANGELIAVISEEARLKYFGDVPSVVGKWIEADNVKYRVCGVVKSVPSSTFFFSGDLYLPYTVSKKDYRNKSYQGNYTAVLLARNKADLPKIRQEWEDIIRKIPMENKEYDRLYSHADRYLTAYVSTGQEERSGVTLVFSFIAGFVILFMLLPTLNLININITRIMERSSEIGVRKAFGASSRTLVYQFLVENIILTLLGGAIGIALAWALIRLLNGTFLLANMEVTMNGTVLFYGLLVCLLFGILSGVYPAWRMSRLNVVNALKSR